MSLATQAKLYFVAAVLFVIATLLDLSDGVGLKTVAGLIMAGVMLSLGLKARKASADGGAP